MINTSVFRSTDANEIAMIRSEKSRSDVPIETNVDLKNGDIRLFCAGDNVSNRSETERRETVEKSMMNNTQLSAEKKVISTNKNKNM